MSHNLRTGNRCTVGLLVPSLICRSTHLHYKTTCLMVYLHCRIRISTQILLRDANQMETLHKVKLFTLLGVRFQFQLPTAGIGLESGTESQSGSLNLNKPWVTLLFNNKKWKKLPEMNSVVKLRTYSQFLHYLFQNLKLSTSPAATVINNNKRYTRQQTVNMCVGLVSSLM